MKSFKEYFRQIKKFPTWIFFFPALILKGSCLLLFRRRIVDPMNLIENARGCVTVTWHNRLLYFPAIFPKAARKRTVAVVSASRDGQYVSDLISFFGIKAMRGSSKKRGANALLGATRAMKDGFHVCFTPDGPRGPKYTMSRGPIHLASTQGAKLIPISINASRYWAIRSWDNFQIPKPFSTLTLVIGEPVDIPADLDEAGLEEWRLKAQAALMEITVD
jgi:lysophospholipid acyltransferase (LPLAT)-like uncharacterized protein